MTSKQVKPTEIIICYEKAQAFWAIQYSKARKNIHVIILAPTLAAQLTLKQNGYPFWNWYEIAPYFDNTSDPKKRNLFVEADKLVKLYKKLYRSINASIFGLSLFEVLGDNLKYLYVDILYNYSVYTNLLRKWKPQTILVPILGRGLTTGNLDNSYSFASYITIFHHPTSPKIISYQSQNFDDAREKIARYISYVRYRGFPALFALLYKLFFNRLNTTDLKKTVVFMQTGGIITSYFYRLYQNLLVNFTFTLVTYKLQLYQQFELYRRGIPFIDLLSFWKPDYDRQLETQKVLLENIIQKMMRIKVITPKKISSSLHQVMIAQTASLFRQRAERTIKSLILNKKLLSLTRPKLVINTHDPALSGTSFVLPAQMHKIPTLLLLHGIPFGRSHPHYFSDHLLGWGEKTLQPFKKYARKSHLLRAVGLSEFDDYFGTHKLPVSNPKQRENILNIGVFLSPPFPSNSYQDKFLHELLIVLSEIRQQYKFRLNIRFHEGSYISGLSLQRKVYNIHLVDRTLQPLKEFINSNQIIISLDTSALLWTFVFRKPVIHVHSNWDTPLIPTSRYRACWQVHSASELLTRLREYLHNPESAKKLFPGQIRFIKDFAGITDGKATVRLIKIIKKLAVEK